MGLPEYQELDLKALASKLTWHRASNEELHKKAWADNRDDRATLPLGTLCRDAHGENIWLVGNADKYGEAPGVDQCGCEYCHEEREVVTIAFLAELLKGD